MAPYIDIARLLGQISGWKFDDLGIIIRQRLCEALYAAGRTSRGGEVVLEMAKTFRKEVYRRKPIVSCVSGESAFPSLSSISDLSLQISLGDVSVLPEATVMMTQSRG